MLSTHFCPVTARYRRCSNWCVAQITLGAAARARLNPRSARVYRAQSATQVRDGSNRFHRIDASRCASLCTRRISPHATQNGLDEILRQSSNWIIRSAHLMFHIPK